MKKVSDYKKEVLQVNAELKRQTKSLGGCRSILLAFADKINLCPVHAKLLKESKDAKKYKVLQPLVRKSKAGNYSPFYLLQALRKNEETLQNKFLAIDKRAEKVANRAA